MLKTSGAMTLARKKRWRPMSVQLVFVWWFLQIMVSAVYGDAE